MKRNEFDIAIAKYQVSIDKNISESEVLWNRYSAMLVFNSILIASIGLTYQDNIHLPDLMINWRLLPTAGIISCLIWIFVTYRGFRWIDRWIKYARKLEEEYLKDDKPILNPVSNSRGDMGWQFKKKFGLTEIASYIVILLAVIIYLFFFFNVPHGEQYDSNSHYKNQNEMHWQYKYWRN